MAGNVKEDSPKMAFAAVKKVINDDCLESLNTKNLGELCNSLKLKASGTKSELLQRLLPFKDDPALLNNRMKNISVKYSFTTALLRQEIPPPTAGWKCNTSLFLKTSKDVIKTYQSNKRQGMIGQFRKPHRMFSPRRMKTIEVFKNGSQLFVKPSILKSFSSEVTRTATVLFIDNVPKKGFCECAVGKCGLCCHVIVILLQLEHFATHKKLFLSLTCTEKLQKWHRPNLKKGKEVKANLKAAAHIRLKYFRNAKSARHVNQRTKKKVVARGVSDENSDWLKRDISSMSSQVVDGLSKCRINLSNHFLKTLEKFKIRHSGLYHHLSYKNAYLNRVIQNEHDYTKLNPPANLEQNSKTPSECEDKWHSSLKANSNNFNQDNCTVGQPTSECQEQTFCADKTQELLELLTNSKDEIITVKVPQLKEVRLTTSARYIDVQQGTSDWLNLRTGVITASKLPSLLGFHGNKEFDSSWFYILNKVDESKCKPKQYRNFQRGNYYEKEALEHFQKLSGKSVYSKILIVT